MQKEPQRDLTNENKRKRGGKKYKAVTLIAVDGNSSKL